MGKKKVIWAEAAVRDLDKILIYYEERNGNAVFSKRLLHEFKKLTKLIQQNNFLERPVESKDASLRVFVLGNYLMFYEIRKDIIEIKLVWDNRQNPAEIPDTKQR